MVFGCHASAFLLLRDDRNEREDTHSLGSGPSIRCRWARMPSVFCLHLRYTHDGQHELRGDGSWDRRHHSPRRVLAPPVERPRRIPDGRRFPRHPQVTRRSSHAITTGRLRLAGCTPEAICELRVWCVRSSHLLLTRNSYAAITPELPGRIAQQHRPPDSNFAANRTRARSPIKTRPLRSAIALSCAKRSFNLEGSSPNSATTSPAPHGYFLPSEVGLAGFKSCRDRAP